MKNLLWLTITVGIILASYFLVSYFQKPDLKNFPPRGTKIIAFGDSITEGVGGNGKGYPELVGERIGIQIINAGISGNTTADGAARLETDVINKSPDIVLVALGGNDALRKNPEEETFANLRNIIDRIQSTGAMTILIGVRGRALSDPYEERFKLLAEETGSYYVPNILDGLFANPKYMSDAVHPNSAGYEKIADRLAPIIQDILSSVSR
jgi:lysophospholipase L1-like esterase